MLKINCTEDVQRGSGVSRSDCNWEERILSTFKDQQNGRNTGVRYHPMQYIFYSIVNSSICMDQGSCAAAVARSFTTLHNKVEEDQIRNEYLEKWREAGEKIIVLKGCNQRHLKYLKYQLRHVAVATHSFSQFYGKGRVTVVLTVFGQQDNLNRWLGGLPELK